MVYVSYSSMIQSDTPRCVTEHQSVGKSTKVHETYPEIKYFYNMYVYIT